MSRNSLPLLAAVLRYLRDQADCTQGELEQAAGYERGRVSKIELGSRPLDRAELERLVCLLGYDCPAEVVDRAVAALSLLPSFVVNSPDSPGGLSLRERRILEAGAGAVIRGFEGAFCELAGTAVIARRWQRERATAARLWGRLRAEPEKKRRQVVKQVIGFHAWAMCERLCDESIRAAAHDAGEARLLADLALIAAQEAPGEETWRRYLQGYAHAFVGNSWRVAGDLRAAEVSFQRSDALSNEAPPIACPLNRCRRLSLKATLRKNQQRYAEALLLLEEALSFVSIPGEVVRLLIKKASVHEKAGSFETALADLDRAAPFLKDISDLRLDWLTHSNRTLNLWHLGRFREAREILEGSVKPLTLELGNDLDRLRVRLLEGRIVEGLGNPEEAVAAFQEVWRAFADRGIAFDAALAALELAALQLEMGRTREVKALAGQAAPIFEVQEFPGEVLASVHLFWTAARREEATATAARLLLAELQRLGPVRRS